VGEVVTLEVLREGRGVRFPVAVGEHRDLAGLADAVDPREHMVPRLGILGLNLTDQTRELLPTVRVGTGVIVASPSPAPSTLATVGLPPAT
jgi:hypothetical protein